MRCPQCHSDKVGVVKTISYDASVVRIRYCDQCGQGWETEEIVRRIFVSKPLAVRIAKRELEERRRSAQSNLFDGACP